MEKWNETALEFWLELSSLLQNTKSKLLCVRLSIVHKQLTMRDARVYVYLGKNQNEDIMGKQIFPPIPSTFPRRTGWGNCIRILKMLSTREHSTSSSLPGQVSAGQWQWSAAAQTWGHVPSASNSTPLCGAKKPQLLKASDSIFLFLPLHSFCLFLMCLQAANMFSYSANLCFVFPLHKKVFIEVGFTLILLPFQELLAPSFPEARVGCDDRCNALTGIWAFPTFKELQCKHTSTR